MKKAIVILVIMLSAAFGAAGQYDKDVFEFRGRNALADGKYALAIENFNILARLDTSDYWTFFFRGIAKYNLGDLRGALQDFNTSVRLDPVFTNGYHYRAITLSRFSRYDEAFSDFERAIELRPGYMGLYFSRGVTYFLSGNFDSAVKDFDRYIRKEPKDPSAYLNRGASYLFLGDTLKAFDDYNKAIRLDRFEPEGYLRRGRLYAQQQKYDLAITDMDHAIDLDSTSTFAYFNRALMFYDAKDYMSAMDDLNRVLRDEPGNALTLYNRALIYAQVDNYDSAIGDMDRVININPKNVLAYYNRAAFFAETGRWQDALEDYNKAIELYPDFAKAYMNRSYVENMLGHTNKSKADYKTAQEKIAAYKGDDGSFADTTKKYSGLLALDADFAKNDFNDELLQHRDVDIKLKPLYRFVLSNEGQTETRALEGRYENALVDRFADSAPITMKMSNSDSTSAVSYSGNFTNFLYGDSASGAGRADIPQSEISFIWGLKELQAKQYNSALSFFDTAIAQAESPEKKALYEEYYKAFYYMSRGALRAAMIDFMSSIQSNVQTLTMDDKGATRARVSDRIEHQYDYSEALEDMKKAAQIAPDVAYIHFDVANLQVLSSQLVEAIEGYGRAINLYPGMGEAYYNRALVLIYLRDKEKGCIDLSRAGELGVADAYGVIKKYCEQEDGVQ